MKKILCILIAVILLIIVVSGIYFKVMNSNNIANEDIELNQSQIENSEEILPEESEGVQLQKFMFPLMEVYCNVPEEYERDTNRGVAVAIKNVDYIATIYNGSENVYSGELEGILDFVAKDYLFDSNIYLYKEIEEEELKASSFESVTVSGYDAVKFRGPVKNVGGSTYEIYGYAMIIEDTPVVFMGILCSEEQAKEELKEMQDLVDLMAGSIYM